MLASQPAATAAGARACSAAPSSPSPAPTRRRAWCRATHLDCFARPRRAVPQPARRPPARCGRPGADDRLRSGRVRPRAVERGRARKLVHVDCVPADPERRLPARRRAAGRHRRHTRRRSARDRAAGRKSGADRACWRRSPASAPRLARRSGQARRHAGASAAARPRPAAAARRGHDALLRHGLLPHLDGAPSARAPAAPDPDQQRPADAGRGPAVGDRGVPRRSRRAR